MEGLLVFFKVNCFLFMPSLDIPACLGIPVSLGISARLTGFLIWVVPCVSVSVTAIFSPNVSVMCISVRLAGGGFCLGGEGHGLTFLVYLASSSPRKFSISAPPKLSPL